jgi:hypothetical protein
MSYVCPIRVPAHGAQQAFPESELALDEGQLPRSKLAGLGCAWQPPEPAPQRPRQIAQGSLGSARDCAAAPHRT